MRCAELVRWRRAAGSRRCRRAACWRVALRPEVAPYALAMASSTRLSFSPMRRSPVMILMMYLASRGVTCESSSRTSALLAAGPRAAAILRKAVWTSTTVGSARSSARHDLAGLLPPPLPDRPACGRTRSIRLHSCRTVPAPDARATCRRPGGWFLPRRERACRKETRRPPRPRPSTPPSSSSATMAIFSSFLVVAAIRSQVWARVCMSAACKLR